MPLIEVLPNVKSVREPGWAYVPDTGFDPSKAALNPTNVGGKRSTRHVATFTGEQLSQKERAELEIREKRLTREDSHRDIPIPAKYRVAKPQTPATKKILGSNKTFHHHLLDEEARLEDERARVAPQRAAQSTSSRTAKAPPSKGKRASLPSSKAATPAPVQSQGPSADGTTTPATPMGPPPLPQSAEENILMKTDTPGLPTEDEIQALLSGPPLSYNEAKAAPLGENAPPRRRFCELCGYWGSVKCRGCHKRYCGLECLDFHQSHEKICSAQKNPMR